MNKLLAATTTTIATLLALGTAPVAQAADTGPWLVRVRALNLDAANKDNTGLRLSVNDKTFPEVDISYFLSPNVALELVLTYPQKHDVRAGGTNIGSLKHLPPTLSAQYHFTGLGFRPYVGAGVNATFFSDVQLPPGVSIDKSSFGLAVGAGVDIPVGNLLLNFDVKKVQIKTDVKAGGNTLGTFKVDPLLFSVGLGWRF